jgi:hypothetical protein
MINYPNQPPDGASLSLDAPRYTLVQPGSHSMLLAANREHCVQKFFPKKFFQHSCAYAESSGQKRAAGSRLCKSGQSRLNVRFTPKTGQTASILVGPIRAMCGRLRVGKENLHVAGLGRCSHVFGLLARLA